MVMRAVLWEALFITTVTCSSSGLPPECSEAPNKACIPKCCPEGYILQEDRLCHYTNSVLRVRIGENSTDYAEPESYIIVYGNPCKSEKFPLDPSDKGDYSYLLHNGSLVVPYMFSDPLGPTEFCMEMLLEDGVTITTPFICFSEVSKAEKTSGLHSILYPIGLLISVPFLIATILVYNLVPGMLDLHAKALCSYCGCLAVAYLFLVCAQLGNSTFNNSVCNALAFTIQFFFMAAFFWLNILSVDTFWSVLAATELISMYPGLPPWRWQSSKNLYMVVEDQVNIIGHKLLARKVFVLYSLYAWCVPLILFSVVVLSELHPTVPSSYFRSHMDYSACWFSTEETALRYFYAPIATILVVNSLLFAVTMYRVIRFNWNPTGPHRLPKQKARMCLILFLTMGISWISEIVSWAVGGRDYAWVVLDAFNLLQGVIIFLIYVWEPRVRDRVLTWLWNYLPAGLAKYACCRHRTVPNEDVTMVTILSTPARAN